MLLLALCMIVALGLSVLLREPPSPPTSTPTKPSQSPRVRAQPHELQHTEIILTHNQVTMTPNMGKGSQTSVGNALSNGSSVVKGNEEGLVGSVVPVLQAMTDCLVFSVLHEPQQLSTTSTLPLLIGHLETLSKALQKGNANLEPWQQQMHEEKDREENLLWRRITDVNKYLEERVEALCSLQRIQRDFEGSVQATQAQLEVLWARLEELHVRVTPSQTHNDTMPDSTEVLTDTQTLFSDLEQSKKSVHQCQTHLAANSKILLTLDHDWLVLSQTVSPELLQSCWTSDLLQSNNEKFNEVLQRFTSLEQQTSTFVTHLKGLEKAVILDKEKLTRSHSWAAGSPIQGSASPQGSSTQLKAAKPLLRVKSGGLCGLRKRKK